MKSAVEVKDVIAPMSVTRWTTLIIVRIFDEGKGGKSNVDGPGKKIKTRRLIFTFPEG